MRLVFLSYHYSPDIRSPEEWFERIGFYTGWAEMLSEKHTVFRVDQIDYEGHLKHHGIQYHFVRDGDKTRYFPRSLNRFVKTLNPDVVVISSFLYPLQLIQLRKCLGKSVRILVQNHAEKPFSGIKKWIQNRASRKADVFLFTNLVTGLEWVWQGNIHSSKKIKELPEVSSAFYPMDKMISGKKTGLTGFPIFLWVGRLNQNKDPVTAVSAFLKFSSFQPDARLYMIYQSDELLPALKNRVEASDFKSNIIFIGHQPHHQLLYWYNSADFYLSASHHEGSGTALCEAMSCGCIPVVSNIPSFRMIGGYAGQFFEPGNEEDLLATLREAMQLDREEKRTQAIDRFKKELSFESISNKFQEIAGSLY